MGFTTAAIYLILSQLISFCHKLFIFKSLLLDPPHTHSPSHGCQCTIYKTKLISFFVFSLCGNCGIPSLLFQETDQQQTDQQFVTREELA